MTAVEMSDVDEGVRWIGQSGIPFHTPLGVPIVNPFAEKQMQFLKRYRVTGVTLDEASTGVHDFLQFNDRVGPLSGKTIFAVIAYPPRQVDQSVQHRGDGSMFVLNDAYRFVHSSPP